MICSVEQSFSIERRVKLSYSVKVFYVFCIKSAVGFSSVFPGGRFCTFALNRAGGCFIVSLYEDALYVVVKRFQDWARRLISVIPASQVLSFILNRAAV